MEFVYRTKQTGAPPDDPYTRFDKSSFLEEVFFDQP
jgi:hypothetical protein